MLMTDWRTFKFQNLVLGDARCYEASLHVNDLVHGAGQILFQDDHGILAKMALRKGAWCDSPLVEYAIENLSLDELDAHDAPY